MSKKERLNQILSQFGKEERAVLESLGKKRLYSLLDIEHDDELLIAMLRDSIQAIGKELEKEKAEKKEAVRQKSQAYRDKARIETVEPIELYVPKLGRIEIEKNVFSLFCDTFKFSFNQGKRKLVNLYIYYPRRCPLVALRVKIDQPEELFYIAFEEYILSSEAKNWSTFVGIFSQTIFQYLESIGNKTIRRQSDKLPAPSDCRVYDSEGNLIRVIEAKKEKKQEQFTHVTPESYFISLEELRERELSQLDEFGEELEA